MSKEIIIVDNGDTFEGTFEQFADCFFDNPTKENIISWAEKIGSTVEFKNSFDKKGGLMNTIIQHKNGPQEFVSFDDTKGEIFWFCASCGFLNEKEYEAKSSNKDDYCLNCE